MKGNMASTELIVPGEDSTYLALRMEPGEVTDLIRDNLGGDGLSPHELDKVKVPSGGGSTWEVPGLDGIEAMKEIEGIIIERATRRAYWPTKEADGESPDCRSEDGLIGIGDPGGSCAECPFNEFGSDVDGGAGKACKETRQLFLLQPDSLIPIVLTVPPASLANVKAYFLRLLRAQLSPLDVVTKIGLEVATRKGTTTKFSKVTLSAGQRLDPDAKARMRAYAALLTPAMQRAAETAHEDITNE